MDSLTQIALGSAVGVAVMGRRTAVWKAALWGGLCGTLPDLDALIDHGDPIRNMTLHRTETHALFYLTLAAPFIAALIGAIHRDRQFRRWWLAAWLALVTHPLLDLMTVYGTQLGLPFTDFPFYVGSIFIIDPAFTLPLVIGVAVAIRRGASGLRWNLAGLVVATAYLGWGLAAQQHVRDLAERSLAAAGMPADQVLVTPTAFNTVLWRIVAMTPDGYAEGFHSLLDASSTITFERIASDRAPAEALMDDWHVARIAWFSHGFYGVDVGPDGLTLRDLRMGQEPFYTFTFLLPGRGPAAIAASGPAADLTATRPRQLPFRIDVRAALPWLWQRMLGDPTPFSARTRPGG